MCPYGDFLICMCFKSFLICFVGFGIDNYYCYYNTWNKHFYIVDKTLISKVINKHIFLTNIL